VDISYSVSLWNFTHYAEMPNLAGCVAMVREQGYGIELWPRWSWETELRDRAGHDRLRALLAGMPVTLHTAVVTTPEQQREQIDLAAALGAGLIVLHSDDIQDVATGRPDIGLARAAVDYASEQGVRLALENGQLAFMAEALEEVPGLNTCLDIGHVYLTDDSLSDFLDVMKPRLIHLHLHDTLAPEEDGLAGIGRDHYQPGTGGIPDADWALLDAALHEIDYRGIAVLEIRPRNVIQAALQGRRFFQGVFA
jgi:sugar phosphate isomerase/epimerase